MGARLILDATKDKLWFIFKTIRNLTVLIPVVLGHIPLSILYVWTKIVDFVVLKLCSNYSAMAKLDYLCLIAMDPDIQETKSKNLNANLGISCVLKGKIDPKDFFDNFVTNVIDTNINSPSDMNLKHPHIRFYQNVRKCGGYWYYKTITNKFNLEEQVTCTILKSHSDSSAHQEVCNWLSVRYKEDLPLWGILLMYRESTGDTFCVLKVHHVIADGYSMLHLLDLLTNTRFKYQVKDFNDSLCQKVNIMTECIYNTLEYNVKLLTVAKSPFSMREEHEIFLTCISIPVSSIKNIRVNAGVRFQSIMLYLVRNYIQQIFIDVLEENDIPEEIIVANSLPWPKHPRTLLCNQATGAAFKFSDIKKRVQSNREILRRTDEMFEFYHAQYLDRASNVLSGSFSVVPRFFLELGMLQKTARHKLSATYIHLIGSEEYSQVFGAGCCDVNLFCIPPTQSNLTVGCLTTSKNVRISIMGPKWIFPTQEKADKFSHDCFQRAVEDLNASFVENHIYT